MKLCDLIRIRQLSDLEKEVLFEPVPAYQASMIRKHCNLPRKPHIIWYEEGQDGDGEWQFLPIDIPQPDKQAGKT